MTTKKNSKPKETNRIVDESGDPSYYVRIPRIIWSKARDPYDLTFYTVVKDIAGEYGECWLSTPQLALLCMMSEGKIQDCRDYWLSTGYISGELVPYNGMMAWHLSIKNVWRANNTWAGSHVTLDDKLEFAADKMENNGKGMAPTDRVCKRCGATYTATGRRARRCPECAYEAQREQILISKFIKMPQKNFIEEDAFCKMCEGRENLELHLADYAKREMVVICQNCHDLLHKKIEEIHAIDLQANPINSCHEFTSTPHEFIGPVNSSHEFTGGVNSSHESKNNQLKNNHKIRRTRRNEKSSFSSEGKDPKEAWDSIIPAIKEKLDGKEFAMWIRGEGIRKWKWDGTKLVAYYVNSFCGKWFTQNQEVFDECIKQVHEDLSIVFEYEETYS